MSLKSFQNRSFKMKFSAKWWVVFSMLLFMITGCGGLEIDSNWNKHSIAVDGNFNDWEKAPTYFDEEKGIIYGAVNDNENLYFMFRFRDIKLAQKLERRGITVWFNGEGKQEKLFGINYKNENAPAFMPGNRGERNSQRSEEREKIFFPMGKFNIQGDNTIDIISINDINDIEAKAGLNNGIFCYEFKIPLNNKNIADKFNMNFESGNNIKIGFEIAGISEEEKEQIMAKMKEKMSQRGSKGGSSMRGGGGRPGGMSGGRAGGMGRRPGGSGQNDMMKQFEPQEFWATVKLAKPVISNQ